MIGIKRELNIHLQIKCIFAILWVHEELFVDNLTNKIMQYVFIVI